MARHIVWVAVALVLAAAPGRAAGLRDGICEKDQAAQQRAGHPPQGKSDKKPGDTDKGHPPPRPKWWIDPKLRAELGITDPQSAAIEAIWQQNLTGRAETTERLEKLSAALDQMILNAADEAAVIAQVDKVEAARSEANKVRVLMLYRINKLLTPEQRMKVDAKAKAMREQRDRGRGSSK